MAHFWHWHKGGSVRLKIKPDQTITINEWEETEEGFSFTQTEFWLDPQDFTLYRDTYNKGRDCDGLLETWSYTRAYIFTTNEEGFPRWEKEQQRQRDHYAEAMGY